MKIKIKNKKNIRESKLLLEFIWQNNVIYTHVRLIKVVGALIS